MAYYSDIVVDDQTGAARAGVSVTVLKADGTKAALTDNNGSALLNPVQSSYLGFFYFNAADAVYILELRYGGKLVRKDEVIVGLPPAFVGPPGPIANVVDALGTSTTVAPSQRAVNVGLAAKADAATAVTINYLKGQLGSREANVLDIAGWDNTGVNNMASGYQALINQAATAGVPVVMQAGKALLGSTIALPDGHTFRGYGGGGFNGDPKRASTFYIAHTGKGFTRAGSGTPSAISISDMTTIRDQPAVVSGTAWTPTDHNFDFFFEDIADLEITRLTSYNSTRGIYMNGGRNKILGWDAHCFKQGLQMDWSYDTCHFEDLHMWPFGSQATEVRNYMQANLKTFLLKRVDNAFFQNVFSIWHAYAFYIDFFAGDGPNKPAGTSSKLKLLNADLDIGDFAYYVAAAANGHTAKWANVTGQGRDEPTNAPLVQIMGPNTIITGDFTGDNAGSNVVRLGASSTGSKIALQVGSSAWNRNGVGFPAVEVESGGGKVDLLPGSLLSGGGGAPVSAGNVVVWNP